MAPAHARAAATHEDNLKKLCVMCGLSKPGKMKPSVSTTVASDIRDYFMPDFDTESLLMPTGICTKHATLLYRIKNKQKSKADLPEVYDFSQLTIPTQTRGNTSKYLCVLCQLARGDCVAASVANAGTSKKKLPSTSDDDTLPPPRSVTVCDRCLAPLGPGLPHPQPCGLREFRDNIAKLLLRDKRGQEIIASDVIKQKLSDSSSDFDTIGLATRGPHYLRVPKPTNKSLAQFVDEPIPTEEFARFVQVVGLKQDQRVKAAAIMREWHGRGTFEPGLEPKLKEKDKILEPFFKLTTKEMDSSLKEDKEKGEKVQRSVYHTTDLEKLIDEILLQKGFEEGAKYLIRWGLDGGGGFLKVVMNILLCYDTDSPPDAKKKKWSYQQGVHSKGFKDGGGQKAVCHCHGPTSCREL